MDHVCDFACAICSGRAMKNRTEHPPWWALSDRLNRRFNTDWWGGFGGWPRWLTRLFAKGEH